MNGGSLWQVRNARSAALQRRTVAGYNADDSVHWFVSGTARNADISADLKLPLCIAASQEVKQLLKAAKKLPADGIQQGASGKIVFAIDFALYCNFYYITKIQKCQYIKVLRNRPARAVGGLVMSIDNWTVI